MVISTAGGMGPEMCIAIKGLAAAIAEKEGSEYSEVVSVLRARFSFAAARCALHVTCVCVGPELCLIIAVNAQFSGV